MKTMDKTTVECNAHNEANKDAIEAGMIEGWVPNEWILKREAKEKADADAKAVALAGAGMVLKRVWDLLPSRVQQAYVDPTVDVNASWRGVELKDVGYQADVVLEHYNSNSRDGYWRLVVGGYGDKRITKIGAKLIDVQHKQLAKAVNSITEAYDERAARVLEQQSKDAASKRRDTFATENEDFLKTFGLYRYDSNFSVEPDGKVRIASYGWTLTLEQWKEVALLRAKHKAEMTELVKPFGIEKIY